MSTFDLVHDRAVLGLSARVRLFLLVFGEGPATAASTSQLSTSARRPSVASFTLWAMASRSRCNGVRTQRRKCARATAKQRRRLRQVVPSHRNGRFHVFVDICQYRWDFRVLPCVLWCAACFVFLRKPHAFCSMQNGVKVRTVFEWQLVGFMKRGVLNQCDMAYNALN